ncbi:MAG: translation initiation factor IF-2 [Desulfomonilaceae bacterium]
MLTVDDLARDLKVRNEDLLKELVNMGYHVVGPESLLETDDPAALREHLTSALPQREVVEQRIKPTVIRRRVKNPPPELAREEKAEELPPPSVMEKPAAPPREAKEPAPAERPKEPSPVKPVRKPKKLQPARILEMPSRPPTSVERPAQKRPEPSPPQAPETAHKAPAVREKPTPPTPVAAEPPAAEPAPAPIEEPVAAEEPRAAAATVPAPAAVPPEAHPKAAEEAAVEEDALAKRKKRKEKKLQPAQIIGRVELKKEPPREAPREREPEPPRPPVQPRVVQKPRVPEPLQIVTPFLGADAAEDEEARKRRKKEKKTRVHVDEHVEEERLKVRRRKEVILGADLYDERARPLRLRGKAKKTKQKKTEITTPKAIKRRIKIPEMITVSSLAHKMSVKAAEVIQHLFGLGVTATINDPVDFDTASIVASEFGYEAESSEQSEKDLLPEAVIDKEESLVPRPPVITVMGHVDHGKTSLLDAIRSTRVTDQEAGGITQHIGAYKVKLPRGELVFLDTPGHEAFTAMRARGAQVTDFVVLVVAADDGVMDQTREAINHARAANVPIIVAVNKIDKPDADRDRVVRELSEHNLIPEAWGGDTLFTYVSAKTGEGIEEFLEMILLQAELMELKANPNKRAKGTIIEARLDKGKGPVATVLIQEGTLKLGDPFVAGVYYGKVRSMLDHEGKSLESAGPATPVEIQGFSGVPEAGEQFIVVEEEKIARQLGEYRLEKQRQHEAAPAGPVSLDDLLARMQEQESKELNLIIKADVQGSVEAVREALLAITSDEIKVKVIHSGVGAITESDIMLASASKAIIIGFNVRPTPKTSQLAEQEKIDIRLYSVIYEAIEDVKKAMEGMLTPVEKETVLGRAEVRQTFHIPKVGVVAGCYVTWGKLERSNQVRLLRDDVVVYRGRMASMKRFKEDVKEAQEGYECGIVLENFRDVKVGDVIEAFVVEKESAKLA